MFLQVSIDYDYIWNGQAVFKAAVEVGQPPLLRRVGAVLAHRPRPRRRRWPAARHRAPQPVSPSLTITSLLNNNHYSKLCIIRGQSSFVKALSSITDLPHRVNVIQKVIWLLIQSISVAEQKASSLQNLTSHKNN